MSFGLRRPFGAAQTIDERLARLSDLGLPDELAERAVRLSTTHGIGDQGSFVSFFEQLLTNSQLPPSKHDDVARFLENDAQRLAASTLIKRAIPRCDAADDLDTLNATLFRLAELPHDDTAVVDFVHGGMRRTLEVRTGSFQSRRKHFNYHDARDALLGCKRIFDQAGQRFFLDRGTLLGCVREGGFIASDYDIDVGIFGDEITLNDVKLLFEGSEFELTQDFEFKVGVASPTGVQIDFFLTTRERGYFLSKGFRSIHNWYFTPFDLMEYSFLGENFLIPATYEKHLDENYGNWRDPAIFYDLSYNEPCVAYGQGPEAFSYLSKRLSKALRRGWRYYSSAAADGLARSFGIDARDRLPTRHSPTVAPVETSAWRPRPIIVVDRFAHYRPHQRRVIESALSLTPDVRLAVADSEPSDGQPVASAIDRVTQVDAAPWVDGADLDLMALLDTSPRAIAVARELSDSVDATHFESLIRVGCDIAFFDESTVALNLLDSRIVARSAGAVV